jgi:alpha/beta hydrolase fold
MIALTYRETLAGFVDFGADDWNEGWIGGREVGSGCAIHLDVTIDDIDRFVADPEHTARVEGWMRCDGLGGRLEIERGWFNLLRDVEGPRHRHMDYLLHLCDGAGRPVTFVGFKDVRDEQLGTPWSDTSTLFSRLYAGHLAFGDDPRDARLAAGILRIDPHGFGRLLTSIRAHGGSPAERLAAKARWGALFTGRLIRVYAGPKEEGQPDFPSPRAGSEPFQGFAPNTWHEVPERPGLERRILPVRAGDGRLLTLHHVRRAGGGAASGAGDRGPVLLAHGTGVRANLFYTPPLRTTLVDALLDAGHDVWLESWRGSIDLDTCDYTLDEVAVHDHPALVRAVLEETGAERVKAVVHCQGSTSMTMALLAGLLPQVSHVVSNAVSLHVEVTPASHKRLRVLVPLMKPAMPGLDPQWAIRPPRLRAAGFARFAELARRECDNHVCAVANFTYGPGPDVLWRHENLTGETHRWISREFGWVPMSFFRQIGRCADAGHLVAVDDRVDGLPDDFAAGLPRTDAGFTLLAGAENRCFLPAGQRRTHAWLEAHRSGSSELHVLPGYTHMDVFFGRDSAREVFPRVVAGLAR